MSSSRQTLVISILALVLLFTPLFFVSILLLAYLVKKHPNSKGFQRAPYIFVGLFSLFVCAAIPQVNDVAPSTQDQLIGLGIGLLIATIVIAYGLFKVDKKFPS